MGDDGTMAKGTRYTPDATVVYGYRKTHARSLARGRDQPGSAAAR